MSYQRALLIIILCALLSTAACTNPFTPTPASTPSPQPLPPNIGTIRVGYVPTVGFAPMFVAADEGYFEEQGLQVELQSFNASTNMIALLSTGMLDASGGSMSPALLNAIGQALDVRVAAPSNSMPPGYGQIPLLARKDQVESGAMTQVADLRGKRVAINIELGMNEYLLAEALAQADLTVDDVELVTLPMPEIAAALANKAVEAAVLAYPLAKKAIDDGYAVVLMEGDKIADRAQIGCTLFGQRLLDPANREVAVRFLVAYYKAARALSGEGWRTDAHVAIINRYTNVAPAAIRGSVRGYVDPDGQMNRESLEKMQRYMVDRGYTELSEPLPLSRIFDDTYLTEAMARLGPYQP